jgi:aspartyl-tRNA(Asn)/glutamyl-tRNA(Gln) amidotransferase subunit A
VAAGLVPFAIAAEGAGRCSAAAACGVTALRPTYGVLPRRGAVAGSYTLAVLGPVARSAEDCALVLDALAGADPRDPSSVAPPRGLARVAAELPAGARIGVLEEPAPEPAEREAWGEAQALLRAAGAILEPAALPDLPWVAVAALLEGAEATVIREDVVRIRGPQGPAAGTGADLVRAARLRGEAQRALARLLERHDLLLAPAARLPDSPADARVPDRLEAAVALAGLPVVSLPIGLAGARPAGVRLVAPPLEEARLLSAAALFQSRSSYHLQRPPLAPAATTPVAAMITR